MKLKNPEIRWKENSVGIFCKERSPIFFDYKSLPERDLVIPGFDCSEFNWMINRIRFDPNKFVKNFKSRNGEAPGYQRCRALALISTYPDNFNILCNAFCILAYRYILNGMGTIKEIEDLYKKINELETDKDGAFHYRWLTSVWTALAHSYVKSGNRKMALDAFNKVHSYKTIKEWPSALVNILGACFVTGQSEEYSVAIYNTAIQNFNVKSSQNLSEILVGSRILKVIMGDESLDVPPLYLKAENFFSG